MAVGQGYRDVLAERELRQNQQNSFLNNLMNILGTLTQQQQRKTEQQEEFRQQKELEKEKDERERAQKKTELLVTLATKGLISATTLPKEPETVEDFQALATQSGKQLAAQNPEVARRLLEASGIKIPKRPKTFPIEGLGEFYQTGIGRNIGDVSDLTSEQQLQGRALSRKIYGVRGAEYGLPAVYEEMRKGKTLDEIEDSLRYAGQSKEFSGAIRGAMQNITAKWSPNEKQIAFDEIDDYSETPEIQKQAIKRSALKAATTDQQNQIMGKERTVELLDEISNNLEILERNGTPTNWITGNIEGILGRVGLVKNPAMREVATKIAVAVMAYRRSMTGVQFGMIENKEYKRIFPNIDKINAFNVSTAKALKSVFSGDTNKFYSQSMGEKNYRELFGEQEKTQEKMQDMVKIRNKKTGEEKLVPKNEVNKYVK